MSLSLATLKSKLLEGFFGDADQPDDRRPALMLDMLSDYLPYRVFDPSNERLEHLPRRARISADPGCDRELIVGGTDQRFVGDLARQPLRDRERPYRFATSVNEVERGTRVQAESAGLADGEIPRVEQLFSTPQRFRSRREGQESGDRADLELSLLSRAFDDRVVEEIGRRSFKLLRHVLQRAHRRPDLPELDRADVRAREVRCAELCLRHT